MPRSSVLLTVEPVAGDTVASVAASVLAAADEPHELRVLDGGAALQVIVRDVAVLSVLRPRMLPTLDEVARLLPGANAPAGTRWWTDVYTPWEPGGELGVAIADALATASGGTAVHQGLAPNWRVRRGQHGD